ncbi:penicillin-binding transpeptidase domain-containing protein [Tessaracoccus rhinocerotis]|uniref:penicillin-binding transpeptidase domain-containing protein n=1 Tax=Tessaracoccus rhinocerotis TaxID=1689449 RepID=UPI00163D6B50|nr:penicillin-binding transpeptidase domain-containing protein [Tessaracoccus rhinocerotis]
MGRRRVAAIVLSLGMMVTGACAPLSPEPDESAPPTTESIPPVDLPSADPLVADLAAALTEFDVTKLPLADPERAQEDLEAIFAGMDGIRPTVTAEGVQYEAEAGTAVGTLTHSYDIGLEGWTFQTTVPLEFADDQWQVTWSPQLIHSQLTTDSRMRHTRTLPKRAPINDNEGLALVEERTLYQVGLDKSQVVEAEWETAAADLARLVEIDPAAYVAKVLAGGPKQFVVARTMTQEEITPDISKVPGAIALATTANVAPSSTFAISILGKTGKPSAEQVAESDGEVWPEDVIGLSGLQARYQERLRGVPEVRIDLVGRNTEADPNAAEQFEEQNLFRQDSSVGAPLELSLDRDLQTRAEEVLSTQPGLATLVVVRPSDGAVLAAANSPAAGEYPQATFGKFAPGSTFKVVSALAMLRKGYTPTSSVECPATLGVSGHNFTNYSDYPGNMVGSITLTQALAHSCNTAFAGAAASITPDELHAAAGSLGVGTDYDAGFTSNFGTVQPNNSAIDRAASMIGQGQITMSPLGMAAVAASVASGKTTIPWVVAGTQAEATAAPLTAAETAALQQMMTAVITQGPGKSLAPIMTGAKTGTAEWGPVGNYKHHGWMISWNQNYAIAAFVEDGVSGSTSAAPLITALFE